MSSPYLTSSLSSGKTPASCAWELEPRGGVAWPLVQDGRSSRDGGGHRDSELPSRTMPTGQAWGSLLGDRRAVRMGGGNPPQTSPQPESCERLRGGARGGAGRGGGACCKCGCEGQEEVKEK